MNIRTFEPSDIQYVIQLHMDIYGIEYGFDETFRNYVSDAAYKFLESYNSEKENLWIVEEDGNAVGSIAIVQVDEETAQLRWYILDSIARGKGIGKELMSIAIQFCKEKNYKSVFLWTLKILEPARHLYKSYGFSISDTASHDIWGKSLVEEKWDLKII